LSDEKFFAISIGHYRRVRSAGNPFHISLRGCLRSFITAVFYRENNCKNFCMLSAGYIYIIGALRFGKLSDALNHLVNIGWVLSFAESGAAGEIILHCVPGIVGKKSVTK